MVTTGNAMQEHALKINDQPWFKQHSNYLHHEKLDHFIEKNGSYFAGFHLIADFWGCSYLDDLERMENAMRDAIEKAQATLLHIHLHHFTPNGGISGVAVLAESHISVHTWPECSFAAFDIFMCGKAKPHLAIETLRYAFAPQKYHVNELKRGVIKEKEYVL
ncbi:adenosylmethionine decarboxylase [Facilibium subflavum]|uniref:adenosylmethionine decarboxylase n=1 Tax=Facilibium subflavum TaxID=2219058 RepID=UPI000E6499A2|nr:adenosylmethionine decarboxylase [Facilibium subflavum]